jgi:hypothetical protein
MSIRNSVFAGFILACGAVGQACSDRGRTPGVPGESTPVYNERTGRLEALESDTNQDGRVDARAHMDGVELKYIETDRDYDGRFDRWEYYVAAPGTPAAARSPDGRSVLEHAEEAGGADDRITRWEFYVDGVLARVEEDTDADGRIDKWELFEAGVLKQMDVDLEHTGRPTRRLIYGPNGEVTRVEADPDGDGTFEAVSASGKGSGA